MQASGPTIELADLDLQSCKERRSQRTDATKLGQKENENLITVERRDTFCLTDLFQSRFSVEYLAAS